MPKKRRRAFTQTEVERFRGNDRELLTRGEVAAVLGVSRTRVRQLEEQERIVPWGLTVGGVRLFARAEVERFMAERPLFSGGRA